MNTLYFISFDSNDNRTSTTEAVKRIGQSMPYAGGWLLYSDADITTLHSQIANAGSGQACVIPVDVSRLRVGGVLNSQAQSFVDRVLQAA